MWSQPAGSPQSASAGILRIAPGGRMSNGSQMGLWLNFAEVRVLARRVSKEIGSMVRGFNPRL